MDSSRRAEANLRAAFDLFDAGLDLMRQNFRRRHANATEQEIEALLSKWLRSRPGAEHGDASGRPRFPSEPAK
jgi:hypothetical protein